MANIYALRTTVGQEKNVAIMFAKRCEDPKTGVKAFLVPEGLRGYVLVEAEDLDMIKALATGIPHVKGVVEGSIEPKEIEKYFEYIPTTRNIEKNDIVEIIAGPFKGEKAKVISVDKEKDELRIELFESTVPIPIAIKGDQVRLLEKGRNE